MINTELYGRVGRASNTQQINNYSGQMYGEAPGAKGFSRYNGSRGSAQHVAGPPVSNLYNVIATPTNAAN